MVRLLNAALYVCVDIEIWLVVFVEAEFNIIFTISRLALPSVCLMAHETCVVFGICDK